MFYSKLLNQFSEIKHCFFSRKNGVSKGIYKSLNCGLGSNDNKNNIKKNLEIINNVIGCKDDFLITLNQKHSNKVIYFDKKNSIKNRLKGDGIITPINNLGIAVLTADCAPILFYDPVRKVIACAHAGWKGALNGIIKNTVEQFNKLNCNKGDIIAAVGPCIKQKNYEVGLDFYEKFLNQSSDNNKCFQKINNNSFLFDLRKYINKKLLNCDIKKIDNIELDTFAEKENFFSYRRSIINKEKDYGRCISVILMT